VFFMLTKRIVILLCCALTLFGLWAEAGQRSLSEKVIRLHVIANSDSKADQALKLQVRDAILAKTETLLTGNETREEAETILRQNLTELSYTASLVISREGFSDQAAVSLGTVWYPTRRYETLSLPAGNYESLRVIIGEGEGHNWWCVVFPTNCLGAVTEESQQTANLTGEDYALLTEDTPAYAIRFKTIEWLSALRRHFLPS